MPYNNQQISFWDFIQSFAQNGVGVDHAAEHPTEGFNPFGPPHHGPPPQPFGPGFPFGGPGWDQEHHGRGWGGRGGRRGRHGRRHDAEHAHTPNGSRSPSLNGEHTEGEGGEEYHGPRHGRRGSHGPHGPQGPQEHTEGERGEEHHGPRHGRRGSHGPHGPQGPHDQHASHGPHGPYGHGPGPREHGHHGPGPQGHHGPRHGGRGGWGRGGWGEGFGARGRGGWEGHGGRHGHRGPPPPGGPGGFDLSALFESLSAHPLAQAFRSFAENQQSSSTLVPEDADVENTFIPPVDTFSTEKAFVLHVALPGAKKEDVGVNWDAEKGILNLAGVVYRQGDEEFLKTLSKSERKVGVFERTVKLPPGSEDKDEIDGDAITAKLEDGVLVVTVPKIEKEEKWTEVKKVDIV